jgi:transposase
MSKEVKIPLDIPDVEILDMEINGDGDYLITVKSTINGTKCRKCGRHITKFHGSDYPITLQHLPILGKKVYIVISPARYKCPYCSDDTTTTQRLPWYTPKSPYTKAYENHVLLQLINSTVEDVSIKEGIGYKSVVGIIKRNIAVKVNWEKLKTIGVLGLDEISLAKRHKNFVTIVTARIDGKVVLLAVLKDRTKKTVMEFLKQIPKHLQDSIDSVCCDMYDGFINAVREVLGKKVKIVIDRFHVAQNYRKSLDKLRKKELKRIKEQISENDYKQLKGAMWALRKSKDKLKREEKRTLALLFTYSPSLELAYGFCNKLTAIFDKSFTKKKAIKKIKNWKKCVQKSGLTCFNSFLSTLDNWMDEITNYFEARFNSGFVEGLNNKIKVIKRRCYGILNIEHLFQRIHLDLEGYSVFT